MVGLLWMLNSLRTNRVSRLVLPTDESVELSATSYDDDLEQILEIVIHPPWANRLLKAVSAAVHPALQQK